MGGGIFNMKIDTFDHKALLGPPKIPGLPDSVQLAPSSDSKKSTKKKKKTTQNSTQIVEQAVKVPEQDTCQLNEVITVDPAKKLRNMRKKLRDIETLEKKLADGTLANPEPEQLEKVARKPVMLQEIADLEAQVAAMST